MRNEESGFGSGTVLLSFLLGGMVGAGLAFLLAPQSGSETRRRISDFADDVRERASGYAKQAKDGVMSSVDKGKDFFEEKKTAISAAFEAGKEAYERELHKEGGQQ
ncbi:MAG: YtxH domain-containing protein [Nitrospirae bacterium]|nr:YtxH domain-containing protein [Nitrospirota bacterium]